MSWGERLRLVHLLLSVGAMLQYGGQGRVLMLVLVVNLLCAWTRFMRCGLYHRLERLCNIETDSINTKNDCSMETKTMDAEMMNGLFSGANFSGEVQIVGEEFLAILDDGSDLAAEFEASRAGKVINSFLERSTETERDLFVMRFYLGESYPRICKLTGFTEGKVKMTLSRMKGKLKDELRKEGFIV